MELDPGPHEDWKGPQERMGGPAGVTQWIEHGPLDWKVWFDSGSGHTHRFQVQSLVGVHTGGSPLMFRSLLSV